MFNQVNYNPNEPKQNVLVISHLYPNPVKPAFGVFVERQTTHVQAYYNNVVVAPVRVFPHLRLWKRMLQTKQIRASWKQWQAELSAIPAELAMNPIPVHYPRYSSLPKQVLRGTWGHFAYPFLRQTLYKLHQTYSFDLIHAHYASTSGVLALLAQRWMQIPIVLSMHGMDLAYTIKQDPISAGIIKWVFRNVDLIFANSTNTANEIISHGVNPEKVKVVFLGGNAPTPSLSVPYKRSGTSFSLLSVGNLERTKGHAYVLHALRHLLDLGYILEYVIVGDGPERQSLENLTHELNLTASVRFEGYKAHQDVWPYFAACDLFVLPSWREGFGIVYIEALGIGKATIGCEGTAGPEDIKRLCPECIELVKPQDVSSLVQSIKMLIEHPKQRQRMGKLGQKLVEQQFTWQQNAKTTVHFYRQLLSNK